MRKQLDLTIGSILLGASLLAIGLVHIVAGHFPIGLIPVTATLPGINLLAYFSGILMVSSAIFILSKKYNYYGALLAGLIYLLILVLVHLPKLFSNIRDAGEWTGTFEVIALLSGIAILIGAVSVNKTATLIITGRYLFALGLIVFGILHCMYAQYIYTLIPAWLPAHAFWNDLVIFGFFGSAVSIIIQKQIKLASLLLSLMFFSWFIMLHVPRAIANLHTEPEWTSAFVALAMSGIALLVRGTSNNGKQNSKMGM